MTYLLLEICMYYTFIWDKTVSPQNRHGEGMNMGQKYYGDTDYAAKMNALSQLGQEEEKVDIIYLQHASGALFWKKQAIVEAEIKKEVLLELERKKKEEEQKKAEQKQREFEAEQKRRREEEELQKKKEERFYEELKDAVSGFPWIVYSSVRYMTDFKDLSEAKAMLKAVFRHFLNSYIDDDVQHLDEGKITDLIVRNAYNNSRLNDAAKQRVANIWNTIKSERVIHQLWSSEYQVTGGNVFGDYFNTSDYTSGVAEFHAIIALAFSRDFRRAKLLYENKEFREIVKSVYSSHPNATRGSEFLEVEGLRAREARDDIIYKIYSEDYDKSFSIRMDKDSLIELCDIVADLNDEHEIDSYASDLKKCGFDIEELVKGCIKNNENVYSKYNSLIKEGFFDALFSSSNSQKLIRELMMYTNYLLIDSKDISIISNWWCDYIDSEMYFNSSLTKYFILHPEAKSNNAIERINEAYKKAITGVDFENVLKLVYEYLGYDVETTKTSGDQGADLVIVKDGKRTVVQAKYYSGSVGNKAVQEVVAAMKMYDAQNGVVVTNSRFTRQAITLAVANNIELIDGDKLKEMIASV